MKGLFDIMTYSFGDDRLATGDDSLLDSEFGMITDSDEKEISNEGIPDEVGILPLKNTVLFPGVMIPITVGRDKSIQLVKDANATHDKIIGVLAQKKINIEEPEEKDLYRIGTLARIHKLFRMPDGSITIVIQGRSRFRVNEFTQSEPYFRGRVTKMEDVHPGVKENQALIRSLKSEANKIIELSPSIPSEARITLQNISSLSFLTHFIASNLNLEVKEKQEILEMDTLDQKAEIVLQYMSKELAVLELTEEIQSKVRSDLDNQQREYFLRQQIKAIQDELGEEGGDTEVEDFRLRAREKKWPVKVREVFDKELTKLSRLMPNMPEYSIQMNYIEWMLELPWGNYSEGSIDFSKVQKILDEDHFGMEKVKDRILEYLAVLKLKADKKAPILCFVGPPGVGKTSLGKSIARSLDRDFVRISLGGVRDEAEIRGHRRTYIGALPGRIIQGLRKSKTGDPVFMLDEIDKVGNDFRGDPSSALLEVLDPEQNNTFQDHFLDVEYDLSRILFIATANTLSTIHPALRDRMEIIDINGYSLEEKMEIAKGYLIPKLREEHGLKASQLRISPTALRKIIEGYTRESGVRKLTQKLATACRAAAKKIVMDEVKSVSINGGNVHEFLGVHNFEPEVYQKLNTPGVAIGLAWTPVGGDILFIETSLSKGTGKLSLTGQLGDVMKESATLAFQYLKANCDKFGIPNEVFKHWDIHIHFPAGAIPKDGPSAGITILTALASNFTQRLVRPNLAMTGEITLRGKVLPVGGIKEKLLAAKRAGIKTILLSKENKKNVKEIQNEYLKDLEIIYVEEMGEVLEYVLDKKKVKNPLELMPPQKDQPKKKGPSQKNIPYHA